MDYITIDTQTDQLINEFLNNLRVLYRSERTIEVYVYRLRILRDFDNLLQVKPVELDRLLIGLRETAIAAATYAGFVQAIRYFFIWLVQRGYIEKSPAAFLRRPKLNTNVRNKAIIQDDLENMIRFTKESNMILQTAMLLFLADTGCRLSEMINLNLMDLDLINLEAFCRGKVGERYLDFTPTTGAALTAWLAIRPGSDPEAIFTTWHGRISKKAVYEDFQEIAGYLKIKRFNPHSIRHRVGQGWLDHGANLELVRQKLGHQDIYTTSRFYGNQDRRRLKDATQQFSLIGGLECIHK